MTSTAEQLLIIINCTIDLIGKRIDSQTQKYIAKT